MNEAIIVELRFFSTSVMWGILLLIFYDALRILRRVIDHNSIFIALEDLLYWVISSVLIFHMMYQQNNGIIRGFAIAAMLLGMILYHAVISDLVVELLSSLINQLIGLIGKIIHFIILPFRFIFGKLTKFFLWVFGKIKKLLRFLLKPLKRKQKSSKIKTSDNEKGD